MRVVHLTASTFFGGPERQMLGLAEHLPPDCHTTFVSFREGGRCEAFLNVVRHNGFDAVGLRHDTPHVRSALRELTETLRAVRADVVLCHGYKPNVLGRIAARRVGIPAVAVSRGWTWESLKVRVYETLDRWNLRFMDRVICVSDGQAAKVRRAGVPDDKIGVIRNSARLDAFKEPDPAFRTRFRDYFAPGTVPSHIVLAAGRLSPEKGFDVLVEAAARVLHTVPEAGFVLFGEGAERARLEQRVRELGIAARFRLPGFIHDLDKYLPWADLLVLPSFTEGLPNVVLEAGAAGVAVVATAVGGTPEVVADGVTGHLVPSGDPMPLAGRIADLLGDEAARARMGAAGRERMREQFSFEAQAAAYVRLFETLCPTRMAVTV
ncbi:glycosyltransferase [Fimbriiglobus ruber]|uniref:Glycosyl transferase, group 1 family protein n=1 Tax=Fimbriiglobus ruber TaxID=1908690 RepID=A0A225E249_9BACT|nr:glycosyltransferase [Fimbriiglobus ruber]OWK47313.1 Glycosyl transferase, group 1 family protein [Fimbriiglobus ruber]